MAHRQYETIAVWPDGILRIEAQEVLPQCVRYRRHRHGGSRIPRIGRLDRIHGKSADGVILMRSIDSNDGETGEEVLIQGPFMAVTMLSALGTARDLLVPESL